MILNQYDRSFRYFEVNFKIKNGTPRRHFYLVYLDGTITNSKGKVMRRLLRVKKQKNGRTIIKNQVRLGNKLWTYDRVVHAAWDSTFDINDLSIVVDRKDGNPYNHRVRNLYHRPKKKPMGKMLNESKVSEIRRLYGLGGTSIRKLGRQYGVSIRVIQRVLNNTY